MEIGSKARISFLNPPERAGVVFEWGPRAGGGTACVCHSKWIERAATHAFGARVRASSLHPPPLNEASTVRPPRPPTAPRTRAYSSGGKTALLKRHALRALLQFWHATGWAGAGGDWEARGVGAAD